MSLKWQPSKKYNLRQIWYMYVDSLKYERQQTLVILLMPDHIHILINAVNDRSMEKTLIEVTKQHGGKITDPVWASEIKSLAQLLQVYKYIYCNPVNSGYVKNAEDYPFSSLQFLLGKEKSPVMIHDPFNFISDPVRILNWLSRPEQFSPFYPTRSYGT